MIVLRALFWLSIVAVLVPSSPAPPEQGETVSVAADTGAGLRLLSEVRERALAALIRVKEERAEARRRQDIL